MKTHHFGLALLSLSLLAACSDESTNFTGRQGAGTAIGQGSDAITNPGDPSAQNPDGTTEGQATGGDPSTVGGDGTAVDPSDPSMTNGGDPSTTTGSGGDMPSSTTGDAITGVKNDGSTTEFGSSAVFRVGDGAAEASSCKTDVTSFNLSGAEYSFVFEVKEDDTTINFYVSRLCGVDVVGTNFLSLVNQASLAKIASYTLPARVISPNDVALEPFAQAITLAKGRYAIRVNSEPNPGNNNDRDDFLIGNIKINANKPILGTGIEAK